MTQPLISVLIPTLPERRESFDRLVTELDRQKDLLPSHTVEILTDSSPRGEKTIGEKRNRLVNEAKGKYCLFIDDDDDISRNFLKLISEAIIHYVYPDCISLKGVITWNGDWNTAQLFEHSIKYNKYHTNEQAKFNLFHWVSTSTADVTFERFPNHLSCIKTDIAKQFKFPHNNFGEDTSFAEQVYKSGLIKTEGYIDQVLYHYDYRQNK